MLDNVTSLMSSGQRLCIKLASNSDIVSVQWIFGLIENAQIWEILEADHRKIISWQATAFRVLTIFFFFFLHATNVNICDIVTDFVTAFPSYLYMEGSSATFWLILFSIHFFYKGNVTFLLITRCVTCDFQFYGLNVIITLVEKRTSKVVFCCWVWKVKVRHVFFFLCD